MKKLIFCIILFYLFIYKTYGQSTLVFNYDNCGNRINKKFTSSGPSKPTIIYNNNNLISSSGQVYQWYFNYNLVDGGNNQTFNITQNGVYNVQVNNGGCLSPISDSFVTLHYIFTGNGNWTIDSNWKFYYRPPTTLLNNFEVIIDPLVNGMCFLNEPLFLLNGSKLVVQPGKKLELRK
ncbi:MAG: hypothetical protein V4556_14695 [Bacteroidota bacterium]